MDDLIKKLESAECGSREFDAEIALCIGWTEDVTDQGKGLSGSPIYRHTWTSPDQRLIGRQETTLFNREDRLPEEVPYFSTSTDAALTLVPADIAGTEMEFHEGYAEAQIVVRLPDGPYHSANAPTPALALCIAALKARQVSDG